MKHWNRRLGVKIACFVLTVPLIAVLVLGTIGMIGMYNNNFYTDTRQEVLDSHIYYNVFLQDCHTLLTYNTSPSPSGPVFSPPEQYAKATRSNLRYQILDHKGSILATNIPASDVPDSFPLVSCWVLYMPSAHFYYTDYLGKDLANLQEGQYAVLGYIVEDMQALDDYYWHTRLVNFGYDMRYAGFWILGAALLLLSFCLVNLTLTAGRRPNSQELFPGRLDRLPTDVLLVGAAALAVTWIALLTDLTWSLSDIFANILICLTIVGGAYCLLGLWLCLASRFKRKTLWKNTLVYKVCHFLWRSGKALITNLPMIWRTALISGGFVFWSFLIILEISQRFSAISSRAGLAIVMILLQAAAAAGLLIWTALQLRRLQKAGQALADGDLHHQLDTTGLVGDFKTHGENLNSIAQGMSKAVTEQMKSQRMKTELITNVSHDIKNPLTSIINYAGLIAQEPCDNEKHAEYAGVLSRKSEHLKRLLEDLVEVSKATTGNMDVELAPCQAGVLLEQLTGEFADRCEAAGLSLVVRQPEEPITIQVDSRRIWRVFENLMGNACKYSLPGSRVYLSLERRGDTAVFTLRNTSREPLDISPDELIERFVRGDSARSTEGNGLGLSIAQSLTQVQGGEMNLGIDGDLFKVTLQFPVTQ